MRKGTLSEGDLLVTRKVVDGQLCLQVSRRRCRGDLPSGLLGLMRLHFDESGLCRHGEETICCSSLDKEMNRIVLLQVPLDESLPGRITTDLGSHIVTRCFELAKQEAARQAAANTAAAVDGANLASSQPAANRHDKRVAKPRAHMTVRSAGGVGARA